MFLVDFYCIESMLFMVTVTMPLYGAFVVSFVERQHLLTLKAFSLLISLITFFLSILLWILFDSLSCEFQFTVHYPWFFNQNLFYSLGLDGLSLLFFILTTFLIPLCILISWNSIRYRLKEFVVSLLVVEFFLLNIFCALDLTLFYIYFESILIPMFVLIGVWGSRLRKIHAAYQFFFYTLLGSVFMLLGILIIYFQIGTTDVQIFLRSEFTTYRQLVLWISFFISFGVKVPMIPTHIWLPEAHVEAPTAGSVLLAGVLLKLGTYGVIRFLIPVFPYANNFFTPLVLTFAILGIIYGSLTTIRQVDLKKIIAYSSVVHMNFALVGLFTPNLLGLSGSVFLMLSHGVVSGALFLCVGIVYERYHTRLLKYYGGLVQFMPLYSFFFVFFTLANIGLPGTSSFIGEFLIIVGIVEYNFFVALLSVTSIILGACYAVWLANRLLYGPNTGYFLQKYSDINRREFFILLPLAIIILYTGVYPVVIFEVFNLNLLNVLYF